MFRGSAPSFTPSVFLNPLEPPGLVPVPARVALRQGSSRLAPVGEKIAVLPYSFKTAAFREV